MHARFANGIVWLVFGQERDALGNLRELAEVLGMRREESSALLLPALGDLQSAWALLLFCALPRANHWLRVTPSNEVEAYAAK